jgi:hypothetical protein
MHLWTDRLEAAQRDLEAVSPPDTMCLWWTRQALLGLHNGLGEYDKSVNLSRVLVESAQGAQQHVTAANNLVGSSLLRHRRNLPADAQRECIDVASAALAHVPAGEGVFDDDWRVEFAYVLTLRHVVATGRAGDIDGRVGRLTALRSDLAQWRASELATSEHLGEIATCDRAVLREVVDTMCTSGTAQQALAAAEAEPTDSVRTREHMLLLLFQRGDIPVDVRARAGDAILASGASAHATLRVRYARVWSHATSALQGESNAAIGQSVLDAVGSCMMLADEVGGSVQSVESGLATDLSWVSAWEAQDMAAELLDKRVFLLRKVMQDAAGAELARQEFLARFPEHRLARAHDR